MICGHLRGNTELPTGQTVVPAVGCDGDTELRVWTPKPSFGLHTGQAVRVLYQTQLTAPIFAVKLISQIYDIVTQTNYCEGGEGVN